MSANVRPRWLSRWTLIGTVAAIALLVAIPSASASAVAPGPLPIHVAPGISLKGESARWDGKNLSTASTASHAFTLGVNQRSLVVFTYDVPLGGPNVTTARMQAIYFGAVISTDQVSTHTNLSGTGSGTMNWTLGTFTYLLAGLYLLTASLVDSNGTTVWSESFYMQASAPYHVGSRLIIFLIVLALSNSSAEQFPPEESATTGRIAATEQAAAKKWGKSVEESRWMWTEYQRRWPSEERTPVKRPDDAPGSWRGEGNRSLKPEANGRVEAACDQIADREREKISPAMRAIESQDPDRHLIGFEHRLKGRDRIKDKVCRGIRNFGRTPSRLFLVCQTRFAIPLSIGRLATLKVSGQTSDALKRKAFSCTAYGMRGRRISTRESTASGSIRRAASGSKCSSTPASASRPSSSHILPTNG